ncbi:MAG: hypothetical protein ACKV0T_05770 [Planctomycetales bacterium]
MDHIPSTPESAVEPFAIKHARDLDSGAHAWLQRVFGRALRDEEDVAIVLSTPHPAPTAAVRAAASKRLERVLDQAAANMQGVSQEDFDAAINEAKIAVRPMYQP